MSRGRPSRPSHLGRFVADGALGGPSPTWLPKDGERADDLALAALQQRLLRFLAQRTGQPPEAALREILGIRTASGFLSGDRLIQTEEIIRILAALDADWTALAESDSDGTALGLLPAAVRDWAHRDDARGPWYLREPTAAAPDWSAVARLTGAALRAHVAAGQGRLVDESVVQLALAAAVEEAGGPPASLAESTRLQGGARRLRYVARGSLVVDTRVLRGATPEAPLGRLVASMVAADRAGIVALYLEHPARHRLDAYCPPWRSLRQPGDTAELSERDFHAAGAHLRASTITVTLLLLADADVLNGTTLLLVEALKSDGWV